MEHLYIADTNLFFEGKRLEDLPWDKFGVDPIVIAVTKPVQAEIDRHKRGGGRTRRRAVEMFCRVRTMLENGVTETIIREARPHVVLRMMVHARPDPDQTDMLDYTLADDRIVGIVSTLSKSDDYASVTLMTDDGGAAMTASGLGLNYYLIDESWKREAVLSEKDKQIADLKKDIAAYRAQEPIIEVEDATAARVSAHVVRRVPNLLTRANVDTMVEQLKLAHPIVTEFSIPGPRIEEDGTEIYYIAPSAQDVSNYTDKVYPSWITQCRTDLERLHEGREEREDPATVTFVLRNTGTRPASKLRISFEAQGDIFLIRRSEDSEKVDRPANFPAVTRLPKPPPAPMVEKVVKRPPKPQPSRTADLAKLAMPDRIGSCIRGLGLTMPGSTFDSLTRVGSVLNKLHRSSVLDEFARNQSAISALPGALGNKYTFDTIDQIRANFTVQPTFIPTTHDPEGFYYDQWESDLPVKFGALTCDLFRHQGSEQTFDVEVLFPKEGDVKGAILCRVQAENLTKPVEVRISVSRTVEYFDLANIAENLVNAIDT